MNVNKILDAVVNAFKKLGNTDHDIQVISSVINKIAPIVNAVYPIVVKIDQLTPTKTGNEILSAFESFGLGQLFVPGADISQQLRTLAAEALTKSESFVSLAASGHPVAEHLINSAIELAVAKLKEESSSNGVTGNTGATGATGFTGATGVTGV
jgi:hypothetical protein